MADYYKRVFDMQEMYKTKNGSVHLSDGEVNLAILNANDPKEPGHPAGLYHFGFHIDDAQETTKRIMDVYPEGAPKDRVATYAEGRASDPDGNLIDISTTGWGPVRRNDL
jgi:catechol-2,3-dioxygenase